MRIYCSDKFTGGSKKATEAKQVMGQDASFLISNILDDESARAPIFGGSLNTPGYSVAVKTGTTDDARDAWTIGYAKQLAVGVWVGNNDNEAMLNGGSAMAGPIWQDTIMAGLKGQTNQPFAAPGGVQQLTVCRSNGLRAVGGGTDGTYSEFFIRTAVPAGTCDVPVPPKDSDNDGVTDDKDTCANTPAGSEVDETGCVVEKEEEEVVIDTDNDGVSDTLDTCANTPANTTVDVNGCPVTNTGGGTTTPGTTPNPTPRRNQSGAVILRPLMVSALRQTPGGVA